MTCQGSGGDFVKRRVLFPRLLQVEAVSLLKEQ